MIKSALPDILGYSGGVLFWVALLSWMFWPSLQNARDVALAGRGPRHRDSGLATPWRRSRPADEYDRRFRADGTRRPRFRPTNARIAVVEMREWTSTARMLPNPLDQIRAVDLSGLQRLAGGPL